MASLLYDSGVARYLSLSIFVTLIYFSISLVLKRKCLAPRTVAEKGRKRSVSESLSSRRRRIWKGLRREGRRVYCSTSTGQHNYCGTKDFQTFTLSDPCKRAIDNWQVLFEFQIESVRRLRMCPIDAGSLESGRFRICTQTLLLLFSCRRRRYLRRGGSAAVTAALRAVFTYSCGCSIRQETGCML